MRLYVTTAGRWAGTQADAARLGKEDGARWEQIEVPTDKPGLLEFLNTRHVAATSPEPEPVPADAPAASAEPRAAHPRFAEQQGRHRTSDEIASFILDDATVAQVEDIFACVGTRVAEIVRARKAA